jgi:hypothetical protein
MNTKTHARTHDAAVVGTALGLTIGIGIAAGGAVADRRNDALHVSGRRQPE